MADERGGPYAGRMSDIGKILAANFRAIRNHYSGTQEGFSEKTGLAQGRISELENAKGWAQITKLGRRLEEAGINPVELLTTSSPLSPEAAEVLELFEAADSETRAAILVLLRGRSARRAKAAS